MDNLTPSFSTTTNTEKIATQITALESMHPYFEYIVIYIMCGIPEVTIKGTPEDWRLLKARTDALRKYKLDWWIDELDPLLDQFINASNKKFNKRFWKNMFKYHTENKYGTPKVIDGWIVKFFPYDKKGKRNNLKMLRSSENLPMESAVVDFKLLEQLPNGDFKPSDMQFVAGFFWLKQNHATQALEPQIGWLVQPKDTIDISKEINLSEEPLAIRVSEIPQEILNLDRVNSLKIEFLDSIKIPVELTLKDINNLTLIGKISDWELKKIRFLFPYARLAGGRKDTIIEPKNLEYDAATGFSIEKLTSNHWKYAVKRFDDSDINFMEKLKDKKIDRLDINLENLTEENKQKIINAYQDTYLIINDKRVENRQFFADIEGRKIRYQQWIAENGSN